LIYSAEVATEQAHKVLSKEFIEFVSDKNVSRWHYRDLRVIAMALLANAHCGADADQLTLLRPNQ